MNRIMLAAMLAAMAFPMIAEGADYKANWKKIEADNGAAYFVDLNSIGHSNIGSADVIVSSEAISEGRARLLFDCHGHFMDEATSGTWSYAAPRSIAGKIQSLACAGAKDTRQQDMDRDTGAGESPADYCAGFSTNSCDWIKQIIRSKKTPSYCKPGFAIEGNPVNRSFTLEQFRICYLMTSGIVDRLKTN